MTQRTIHSKDKAGDRLTLIYGGEGLTRIGEVLIDGTASTRSTYYHGPTVRDALIEAFPLPVPEDRPGMLPVGTRVVVTGDTGGWGHEFEPGQVGTVVENNRGAANGYDGRGYLVRDRFGDEGANEWDVHEDDVLVLLEGVR